MDPAHEFDGATVADAAGYPGYVTPVGFSSPSGNIQCGIADGGAGCQMEHYTYRPKPAHDCHGAGDWGATVRLQGSSAATFVCASDVEGGGPALPYGSELVVGSVRCVSRADGVTCENVHTGRGFWLSRQAYLFFPAQRTQAAGVPQALVGQWAGHGRTLAIAASGRGTVRYRTYRFCNDDPTPPCDTLTHDRIVDGGHVSFTLTSSRATNEARGSVTASSDPQYRVGRPVTAVRKKYQLTLAIDGKSFAAFCDPNDPAHWDCGA